MRINPEVTKKVAADVDRVARESADKIKINNGIKRCLDCDEVMIYNKPMEFWECPLCNGQWWPDERKKKEIISELESEKKYWEYREKLRHVLHSRLTIVNPGGYIPGTKKGCGNKSGRKRKKPKKKANLAYLT